MQVLTPAAASPKLAKVAARRGRTIHAAVLYLSPADASGYEVCGSRTRGCTVACLGFQGRGGIGIERTLHDVRGTNTIQAARARRTVELMGPDRPKFLAKLVRDLDLLERQARKRNAIPAARLNGTADLDWTAIPVVRDGRTYPNVMRAFPEITFYDYTKRRGVATAKLPRNYRLTFSRAETRANQIEAMRVLQAGGNVAAVFSTRKGQALPKHWNGHKVIDGDKHDFRFLDPRGVVVGLRAKGKTWRDRSGFVIQVS